MTSAGAWPHQPPGLGTEPPFEPAPGTGLEPPPGPGVAPPFVAPPTDGTTRRRWWTAGLATLAALICCVGGVGGVGALLVFGGQMQIDAARTTVTDYLGAIVERDYSKAYRMLCPALRQRQSQADFAGTVRAWNLSSYDVGEPEFNDEVLVPATLRYSDRSPDDVTFHLELDDSTGEFSVCGQTG